METLRRARESIRTMWAGLSPSQRALVGIIVFALVVVLAWGVSTAGNAGERRIVGPETPYDVQAEILAELEQMGVRYRVSNGAIYVPADRADEIYVKLQGILSGDMKEVPDNGFFDDRWQKEKRWQVALQSKLARMIRALDGVRNATVQLTPGKESNWRGDKTEGSAVVMVEMKAGASLSRQLVNAIANTVAAGAAIKLENVKVVSGSSVYTAGDAESVFGGGELHDQEIALGRQISQMVEKLLQPMESRVMATVRLSTKRVQEETMTVPERPVPSSEDGTKTDYVVPTKTVTSMAPAGAEITSMSIAVVLPDKPPVPTEDAARAEFLSKITAIVRDATGADERRITVATVPVIEPAPVATTGWEDFWELASRHGGQVVLVILALAIAFAAWRVVRSSLRAAPAVTVEEGRPPMEAALAGLSPQEVDAARLRTSVSEAALREPRETAELVRRMMER